ncbi:tetraspanin-8-like [Cryptomeria japonica]|uniref:tetraspanin-8-like n=1 Tax=Cryptomeria japonica TaxID=3369 RepID=UPI0027DA68A4|nr:tetraspanin-8-like [Cryptomeria japonica]
MLNAKFRGWLKEHTLRFDFLGGSWARLLLCSVRLFVPFRFRPLFYFLLQQCESIAFLLIVSLPGSVGACYRVTWLLWLYLVVVFLLILLLFCFTVFVFVVTNKGAAQVVSDRGYKEYKLGDYSNWLQKRTEKSSKWNKIKSCLQDAKVCKSLANDSVNQVAEQFCKKNLSPLQSGCCKPPTSCGFVHVNATCWTTTACNLTDVDCSRWCNDEDKLCYSCNSCKAGVLANLKHDWRMIAIINIVMLFALVVFYSVGRCEFRNNRRDERNGYGYKVGYP